MINKRILLVDDEEDFLEIMGERIKSWGYEVISASRGKEALDLLICKKPGVVILDFLMPDMNGVEVLKRIREIDKNIPVVMFTAHPDIKVIDGVDGLGVSAFIPKLSVYSDVQTVLQSALNLIEKKLEKNK